MSLLILSSRMGLHVKPPFSAQGGPMAGSITTRRLYNRRRMKASLINWTHGLINRLVMVSDGVVILLAGGVAWVLSPVAPPLTWLQALTVALVMMVSFARAMQWMGCYRVERYTRIARPLFDLAYGFIPSAAIGSVILAAFVPHAWEWRGWLLNWIVAMLLALMISRQGQHLLVTMIFKQGKLRRRVVVVGTEAECDSIVRRLRQPQSAQEYHLVGTFDPTLNRSWRGEGEVEAKGVQVPDLTRYAQNYAVDLVVVAMRWDRTSSMVELIRSLQWIAADVVVPFDMGGLRPHFVQPMSFIGSPTLQVMHRPFKGTQGLIKMIEDYVVAGIALLITAPFMLLAALLIKLDDGGPIMFRQPRTGSNSKPFLIYKLRTMSLDPGDDGSRGTKRDNQRITRMGRFLRRTSIDELPQLFNVLRGEMSIVGPRPHVPNMLVEGGIYSEVVQQYAARHRIKPGITGWAQINGMRGGIESKEKAHRGADLDLYYVANWSLRFDIEIMLKTVVCGLAGRNVF
jgi:putative colanic acid biosynthesis UDP-glucose lipid carrier transferase